jgi:hypothetical protein
LGATIKQQLIGSPLHWEATLSKRPTTKMSGTSMSCLRYIEKEKKVGSDLVVATVLRNAIEQSINVKIDLTRY